MAITENLEHPRLTSLGPNLCAFASLREILYSLVAVRPLSDSVAEIGLVRLNL